MVNTYLTSISHFYNNEKVIEFYINNLEVAYITFIMDTELEF